jgi:hypothetical protein
LGKCYKNKIEKPCSKKGSKYTELIQVEKMNCTWYGKDSFVIKSTVRTSEVTKLKYQKKSSLVQEISESPTQSLSYIHLTNLV